MGTIDIESRLYRGLFDCDFGTDAAVYGKSHHDNHSRAGGIFLEKALVCDKALDNGVCV